MGNFHVTADTSQDQLTLLYKVEQGPATQSFGIRIAELAGFPSTVVDLAKEKVEALETSARSEKKRKRSEFEGRRPEVAQAREGQAERKRIRRENQEIKRIRKVLTEFQEYPLDQTAPMQAMQGLKQMWKQVDGCSILKNL